MLKQVSRIRFSFQSSKLQDDALRDLKPKHYERDLKPRHYERDQEQDDALRDLKPKHFKRDLKHDDSLKPKQYKKNRKRRNLTPKSKHYERNQTNDNALRKVELDLKAAENRHFGLVAKVNRTAHWDSRPRNQGIVCSPGDVNHNQMVYKNFKVNGPTGEELKHDRPNIDVKLQQLDQDEKPFRRVKDMKPKVLHRDRDLKFIHPHEDLKTDRLYSERKPDTSKPDRLHTEQKRVRSHGVQKYDLIITDLKPDFLQQKDGERKSIRLRRNLTPDCLLEGRKSDRSPTERKPDEVYNHLRPAGPRGARQIGGPAWKKPNTRQEYTGPDCCIPILYARHSGGTENIIPTLEKSNCSCTPRIKTSREI